jgi:hypothetical protein
MRQRRERVWEQSSSDRQRLQCPASPMHQSRSKRIGYLQCNTPTMFKLNRRSVSSFILRTKLYPYVYTQYPLLAIQSGMKKLCARQPSTATQERVPAAVARPFEIWQRRCTGFKYSNTVERGLPSTLNLRILLFVIILFVPEWNQRGLKIPCSLYIPFKIMTACRSALSRNLDFIPLQFPFHVRLSVSEKYIWRSSGGIIRTLPRST